MKLTLRVVGDTIQDIENGLREFLKEISVKHLNSNCYISLNDKNNTKMDYEFTNGADVFLNHNDEIVIDPYSK